VLKWLSSDPHRSHNLKFSPEMPLLEVIWTVLTFLRHPAISSRSRSRRSRCPPAGSASVDGLGLAHDAVVDHEVGEGEDPELRLPKLSSLVIILLTNVFLQVRGRRASVFINAD